MAAQPLPLSTIDEVVSAMKSQIDDEGSVLPFLQMQTPLFILSLIWIGVLSFVFSCLCNWIFITMLGDNEGPNLLEDILQSCREFREDLYESFQILGDVIKGSLGMEVRPRPVVAVNNPIAIEENGGGDQGQMDLPLARDSDHSNSWTTDDESAEESNDAYTSESESDYSSQPQLLVNESEVEVEAESKNVEVESKVIEVNTGAASGAELIQNDSSPESDFELIESEEEQ